jgi:hypothetical protein
MNGPEHAVCHDIESERDGPSGGGAKSVLHSALPPDIANLVTLPEQLAPPVAAQQAALHRQELLMEAGNVDAVALALETARTVAPRNSLEQMLVDQLAGAHQLIMTLMAKSQHFAESVTSWDPKARQQLQSIETARLAGAVARAMDTFQRGMLTLERLRNGGRQVMVVQHVQVKEGGRAVVAGAVKSGKARRRGSERE